MTTHYRLYYAPDNASLIVRLALEELAVPYETSLVDRAASGQTAPDYLALNPHGLIPTLDTPDGPVFETGAILLWLADTHGALAPAPTDPDRATFLKWLFFTSNTLHANLRMLFYPGKYAGTEPAAQSALRVQAKANLLTYLARLDDLAATGAPVLGGIPLTMLDLYVCACLRWMALYPEGETAWFSLGRTPHLARLAARIEQRSSVKRATHAEGLGSTPFTAPTPANPPEGSPT